MPPDLISPGDLALISTEDFVFLEPDDILTINTRLLYLKTAGPHLPVSIYFHSPRNRIFSSDQDAVSIGMSDVDTPKGTFLSGEYLICGIAIDQFLEQGVWRVFWEVDGRGAPFYSTIRNVGLQALLTESSNLMITEDGLYYIGTEE